MLKSLKQRIPGVRGSQMNPRMLWGNRASGSSQPGPRLAPLYSDVKAEIQGRPGIPEPGHLAPHAPSSDHFSAPAGHWRAQGLLLLSF